MAGASEIRVDLHGAIDKLRLFKSDLEAYFWDRMGDGALPDRARAQMALWMRQVSERIIDLEDVVVHLGCPIVIVRGSTAEREILRGAVRRLDRSRGTSRPERSFAASPPS